uniref:Centrosomal protein kizuna n=1 Tax=Mola mola TaxID=94237 RepID=A0A3Q3VVD7_MOLML
RLELERELFAYSRSDKRISQIKRSKLRSYLKEICDREARAKMRNLELLRDVECIEIGMKEYSPDHGLLQQQKVEVMHRLYQDCSHSQPAKDFTQPPVTTYKDRQTSKGSDGGADTTSVLSHQALHHSPNRSMHSRERLPSGLLKDFRVGREDAASNRAHLFNDISGSNDSPDRCNLSDKHERVMVKLPSVRALTGTAGNVPFGRDGERGPSPLLTLTGPEKNLSPGSNSLVKIKNSHLTALYILDSFCNIEAALNDEDLEACGAVVLHEKPLFLSCQSLPLFPSLPHHSASLTPDAARLWDRWFKHALLLKERCVVSTECLVQLFTPLLLERHATYSHQVKDPQSHFYPETLFLPATASHYALPFLTELQSIEEDSQDESPVESVPIRGKKASLVPLHSHCPYVVVCFLPAAVNNGLFFLFFFSLSFCIAFWSDSDESDSEIEAALRPQPFNRNTDETDDFCD